MHPVELYTQKKKKGHNAAVGRKQTFTNSHTHTSQTPQHPRTHSTTRNRARFAVRSAHKMSSHIDRSTIAWPKSERERRRRRQNGCSALISFRDCRPMSLHPPPRRPIITQSTQGFCDAYDALLCVVCGRTSWRSTRL